MPSVSKAPTPPVIEAGQVVDLVSHEELEKEVYSKKAIDETVRDIRDQIVKLQDQINELESHKITVNNQSPWAKFKNLFR